MIGVLTSNINIRSEMRVTVTNDVGDLKVGDVVIGTVLNGWIAFDRVFRKALNGQAELLNFTRYAAVQDPTNAAVKFMMLVDANVGPGPAPEPTPAPVLQTLNVEVGGDGYETVNVELRPIA